MVAIYVLSILLVFLYGLLLRPMVWIEWQKWGTDVLVIEAQSEHSREWMARLSPLVSGRAVFLNWNERGQWDNWSLPVQLFHVFGPQGMPERFTEHSLPAVIVFRQLRPPKRFTFRTRSKDLEATLEHLRAELDLG
jgi:hypothetical protein